jgi:hypothetical protein
MSIAAQSGAKTYKCNRLIDIFVRLFWAHFRRFVPKRRKPGYPLQSFLPGTAKKYFRFYPLRGPWHKGISASIPAQSTNPRTRLRGGGKHYT